MKVPLRQAEKQLYALVAAVEQGGERVVLTRRGRPVATLLPMAALDALDLLGRLLPDVAEVAARFPPLDPEAPGLGPAPGDETPGDTTSEGPAENRALEVSVPSPPPGPVSTPDPEATP